MALRKDVVLSKKLAAALKIPEAAPGAPGADADRARETPS